MKILLLIKKSWLKIISVMLILAISFYVLMFGIKKVKTYEILKGQAKQQTIHTIWHIETFEGGSKARINYIKDVCREIENKNDGVLFMVFSVLPQELENRLQQETPDIVSFGFGVGKTLLPHLKELDDAYEVRDELYNSAKFANSLMCVPYISSGYAKFTHSTNTETYCYGQNAYVSPLPAIENALNATAETTQYEAYKRFVYNKKTALIGTARDVFRVTNLNNIGRTNAVITPLNTYTDLIQYCGITIKDNTTGKFLKILLSNKQQKKLVDYSLFGVKNNKLYTTNIYNDMENAIFKARVPNVFD